MIKLDFDKYFSEKGISVRYNTLGNDESLVHSYLEEFQDIVNKSERKKSQYAKNMCYSTLYNNIEPRTKYTGFENYKKIDNQFRNQISSYINKPQNTSVGFVIDHKENSNNRPYKETLIRSLKTVIDPVLYLSGGIDSELVALALLEANVKFIPVIFEYIDKSGKIENINELQYAYKFCKDNCLLPEIYQLDIETLWNTDHFKKLAVEMQISSPQIVTHAYMVEMLSIKYRNSTHLFGGEIRFKSDYIMDNGELANIVFLNKVSPVGYDNGFYSDISLQNALTNLIYDGETGTWRVSTSTAFAIDSGLYTNTPSSQYQFRVQNVVVILNDPIPNGGGFTTYFPAGPTSYSNIPLNASISICGTEVFVPQPNLYAQIQVYFAIEVRAVNQPATVITSNITLGAQVGVIP